MTEDAAKVRTPPKNRHPIVGIVGSVVFHALSLVGVIAYTATPDFGLEFSVPSEMEFGVAEGLDIQTAAPTPAAPLAETQAEGAQDSTSGSGADAGTRHRDAGVRDAGVDASLDGGDDASVDGSLDAGAEGDLDSGALDAGPPLPHVARGTEGRSRLGPGGDIAVRFDFQRMRGTQLEPTVTQFLASVRDFQMIIDRSGMDPVHDLDQFLMGSPDPVDRERYHYVGRLAHDEDWARATVARLAAAHGESADWTDVDGIAVAPWHDADDATAHRVIALLGNRYFVLCRQSDMPRMIAWLAHQAELADRPAADGPAVALGVADDEIISVEMENVRAYLAGSSPEVLATLPTRGRLSILKESDRLNIAFRADYPDSDSAVLGADHWNVERERAAAVPAVSLLGFGRVLNELALSPNESVVRARTDLSMPQVTTLLGVVQMKLQRLYATWDNGGGPPP